MDLKSIGLISTESANGGFANYFFIALIAFKKVSSK